MQLALTLFPDVDGLDGLIETSMPAFAVLLVSLAVVLGAVCLIEFIDRLKHRSPVDKLLRRRLG